MNFTKEEIEKAIDILLAVEAGLCAGRDCNNVEQLKESIALQKSINLIYREFLRRGGK